MVQSINQSFIYFCPNQHKKKIKFAVDKKRGDDGKTIYVDTCTRKEFCLNFKIVAWPSHL